MEEEAVNVNEEIQTEEVIPPQEEVASSPDAPVVDGSPAVVSDKENNFARLRETKEQLERENRELRNTVSRYAPPKASPPPAEDELDLHDDDIVDGKVVKLLYKELNRLKETVAKEKLATVPDRLKNKFSDFDQVVTEENVEKLKESEPELYSSIVSGTDLYAKGVSAYKTLLAMGIAKVDSYQEQRGKVQNNHARPVSAQAIRGQGALAEANIFAKGLTPELKKQLQQEMSEAAKAR